MADEGFREYHAAYSTADHAITTAMDGATRLLDTEEAAAGALLVLAVCAVAQAVQALTLGLRHAAFRTAEPARWRE